MACPLLCNQSVHTQTYFFIGALLHHALQTNHIHFCAYLNSVSLFTPMPFVLGSSEKGNSA